MKLFEIYAAQALVSAPGIQYGAVASNGECFMFLDQAAPRAVKYDRCLRPVEEYATARPYTGLCYDTVDRCYWACSSKDSAVVYKLNHRLAEIDRFTCRDYESCHGWVRAIAHDSESDTLRITYSCMVVEVDKQTHCQHRVTHQEPCVTYKACLRSCGYTFCAGVRCCTEQLTVCRGSRVHIHTCLPADYRLVAMAGMCSGGRPTVYILALKHNRYCYLLQGTVTGPKEDCSPGCCCHETEPGGGEGSHRPETPEPDDRRRPCHHCCESRHDCGHEHHGGSEEAGGRGDDDEEVERGCAEIVQSIALEQTAISHILNAEGEKIQRVVAESCSTDDLLEVNESVMQMVTRLTHLEQVLYAKLEAAARILRSSR